MGEESWQTEGTQSWVVSSSISAAPVRAMSETRDLQGKEGGIGRILKWEKGIGQYTGLPRGLGSAGYESRTVMASRLSWE